MTEPGARLVSRLSRGIPVVLALLLALGRDAAAAPIRITYQVTGGEFSSSLSTQTIMGGNLSFLTEGPDTMTGSLNANGTLTKLTLTGTGTMAFVFQFIASTGMTLGQGYFNLTKVTLDEAKKGASVISGGMNILAATLFDSLSVSLGIGNGQVRGLSSGSELFAHTFDLGNEQRALIPEPATGLLLGVGLGALAGVRRLRRSSVHAPRHAASGR